MPINRNNPNVTNPVPPPPAVQQVPAEEANLNAEPLVALDPRVFVDPLTMQLRHVSAHRKLQDKIPLYVKRLVADLDLMNIDDQDERARVFLRHLFQLRHNIRGQRVKIIFKRLKPELWPDTEIEPKKSVFDMSRPRQTRTPNFEMIDKLVQYLYKQMIERRDSRTYPILMSYFTALRRVEVCNMTAMTLYALYLRRPVINLKRKTQQSWNVLYFDQFNEFITILIKHKTHQLYVLSRHGVDLPLFETSPESIHYNIRHFYLLANGVKPPYGFGIHVFRYYLATKLREAGHIEVARVLLGHKDITTTERYIKPNMQTIQAKVAKAAKSNEFYRNCIRAADKKLLSSAAYGHSLPPMPPHLRSEDERRAQLGETRDEHTALHDMINSYEASLTEEQKREIELTAAMKRAEAERDAEEQASQTQATET